MPCRDPNCDRETLVFFVLLLALLSIMLLLVTIGLAIVVSEVPRV